jgi:succinate-acetate transporter protein
MGVTEDQEGAGTPAERAAVDAHRAGLLVTLRPVASPLPLGLFGLAAATLVISGQQLAWVPTSQTAQVALALIGFAFPAQLIAAGVSFRARDIVAATAMATLGLTWLVVGLVLLTGTPGATSRALGLFLIFSAVALALTAATAAQSKLVPALVFVTAAVRFLLTAVYQLSGEHGWEDTAGVVGLILFGLAVYAAWASELEGALRRPVLPLGRRGAGQIAISGSLLEQTASVANEPGVRQQL